MRPTPALIGLALVAIAMNVHAEDTLEVAGREATERYVHAGFYFRAGIGASGLSSNETIGESASTLRGSGPMGEISIGSSVIPGVIVAGTFLTYTLDAPTVESGGRITTLDQREHLGIFGMTMDWYPFPQRGLHMAATLGGGLLRGLDSYGYVVARSARYGSAFSIGLGYDWWVARDVSIGVLARATGAQLGGDERTADGRSVWADTRIGAASLMLTALYQ